MAKALKIACIGEAMVELSLEEVPGSGQAGVAGDTLNAAIYLRRALPEPHRVSYVTVLGTDPLSDQIVAFINSEDIATDTVRRDCERLPGIYAVTTDEAGERSFLYWRENSAARTLFQNDNGLSFDVLEGFDVVYMSAITLAILPAGVRAALFDWIGQFRAGGGKFAFDSNYRPRLWQSPDEARQCIDQAWRLCDIAFPSLDDELALFGEADEAAVLARFRAYGIPEGALKRASHGPVPLTAQIETTLTFAPAQRVVDTTAAGDSFVGAFLACHLLEGTLAEALMAGHSCAVSVVGHKGAIVPRDLMLT